MRMSEFRRAGHTPSLIAALLHFDISFAIWVILSTAAWAESPSVPPT